MTHDDVLTGYRRRLFTLAQEIGVRPACRAMGVHHSTYYRLKKQVDRFGLEGRSQFTGHSGARLGRRIEELVFRGRDRHQRDRLPTAGDEPQHRAGVGDPPALGQTHAP